MIKAIFAHDGYWGIGKNGTLPWPTNKKDLKWFKEHTSKQVVVMGRKTWESLPKKPLPNRINVVVSKNKDLINEANPPNLTWEHDPCDGIKHLYEVLGHKHDIWVIGGAQLLTACLPVIDEIWLNNVGGNYECDTVLPKMEITKYFHPEYTEARSFGLITKWIKR